MDELPLMPSDADAPPPSEESYLPASETILEDTDHLWLTPQDGDAPPLDEADLDVWPTPLLDSAPPVTNLAAASSSEVPKRRLNLTPPEVEREQRVSAQISSDLYSLDAEEAVLGCILINPDESYFLVAPFLRPEDFYFAKHRWVWESFIRLHEQRLPVDLLTVAEELERHNHLGEVGGSPYLSHLLNVVPTSLHAEAYGRIVQRDAMRRRLLDAATKVAKLAYIEDRDIGEVVSEAEAMIFEVSEQRLHKELIPIGEALSQYYDRIQYLLEHKGEPLGVPSGFVDLDRKLGGFQKSDLLIIAGRPGSGKTGFMLSIAKNAAQLHHKHVAIFSLEMGNEQLVQRLISQETGINAQRLRLGDLHDDELPLFSQSIQRLSEIPIFLDDTPALTPLQLRAKCRRLQQEHGLDLVIVDYLQLMQSERKIDNRVQEVSHISRGLKQLARELNVPILTGAQLSRAVEQRQDKRPVLSDLRESGSLEQDADIVMFIHRPDLGDKDGPPPDTPISVIDLMVAKHRNGPTGEVQLIFRRALARFENAVVTHTETYNS